LNFTTLTMTMIGVGAGLMVGVLLANWQMRRVTRVGLHIPSKWPLVSRALVTDTEAEVWHWLRSAFHDHLVMIKTPVLRFTIPMEGERHKSREWLEMLNGVYTTFTVCTMDGTVVGCVDVPGKRGLPQSNREIKEALLSDCNISYTVVRSSSLPKVEAMRAAFLGEIVDDFLTEPQPVFGEDSTFQEEVAMFTKDKMRAAKEAAQREINQQARARNSGFNGHNVTPAGEESGTPSRLPSQWQDSFIEPAENRPGKRP
jgi:hypothetical protein